MSQFFDELARTLATPMPRRRAMRLLGGALVATAFPTAAAKAARGTHDCPAQNAFLCQCPSINGLFYKICCPNKTATDEYECRCKAPPNGYAQCFHKSLNRCEQSGTLKCGKACCDDETEKCVDASRGQCCKKTDSVCAILAPPGSAQRSGAKKCCPPSLPNCCANDKRSACCEPTDSCCAGRCCPRDKTCDKKTGQCNCPKSTKPCGTRECCKKDEVCSNGKCCPTGEVNCGSNGTCCDKIDCCGGKCCKGSTLCVNGTCCPPERGFGSGANARCCPPGTIPSANGCCPRAIPNCCAVDDLAAVCGKGLTCVSGACVKL